MALQQGPNVIQTFKAQASLGTEEPGGSGSTQLIYKDGSPGFSPVQAALIESSVNLGDGLTERARRGTYNVPGSFNVEAACGNHALLYPTFFKNDWATSITITQATGAMSSATLSVSGSVITFSAGSVITAGVRVGDAVKFASGLDAADNGKWLRVRGVTATTITVYETLTTVSGPVATYSFTVPSKLTQSTLAKIFTFDTYFADFDQSIVTSDVKGNTLGFSLTENGTLDVAMAFLGAYQTRKPTNLSPHFSSPTVPTGTSLAFLDGCFAIAGSEQLEVTGFSLDIDLSASTLSVANGCGPRPGASPDVFQGNGAVSGQFSLTLPDFQLLTAAAGETQIDFIARFRDPNGVDVFQLSVLNAILSGEQLSAIGTAGAMTQTFNMAIGRDKRGGAFDRTSVKLIDSQA